MNQIKASILYKHDNALSLTSVDNFELGFRERKDVHVKFVTIVIKVICSTRTQGSRVIWSFHVLTRKITYMSRKLHETTFIEAIVLIFQ